MPAGGTSDDADAGHRRRRTPCSIEGQPFSGGLAAGPNEYLSPRGASGWGTQSLSTPTMTGATRPSPPTSPKACSSRQPGALPGSADPGRRKPSPTSTCGMRPALQPLVSEEPPTQSPDRANSGHLRGRQRGQRPRARVQPPGLRSKRRADRGSAGDRAGGAGNRGRGRMHLRLSECNLYEWDEGELRLINVLPDEGAPPRARYSAPGGFWPRNKPPTSTTRSPTTAAGSSGLRKKPARSTSASTAKKRWKSPARAAAKQACVNANRACFLTASADGSKVLLADGQLYELDEGKRLRAHRRPDRGRGRLSKASSGQARISRGSTSSTPRALTGAARKRQRRRSRSGQISTSTPGMKGRQLHRHAARERQSTSVSTATGRGRQRAGPHRAGQPRRGAAWRSCRGRR